jgi:hypothetical protein
MKQIIKMYIFDYFDGKKPIDVEGNFNEDLEAFVSNLVKKEKNVEYREEEKKRLINFGIDYFNKLIDKYNNDLTKVIY